jgi:hypothetical protein
MTNPVRIAILSRGLPKGDDITGTPDDLFAYITNPYFVAEYCRTLDKMDALSARMYQTQDPQEVMRLKAKVEALMTVLGFIDEAQVTDRASIAPEEQEAILDYLKEKFYARARSRTEPDE